MFLPASLAQIPLSRWISRPVKLSNTAQLLLGVGGRLILFVALFAMVQFATPSLADNDGFYHMRMAWLMRQEGLKPDFVWLPLTILSPDAYYNHHFLHQVYLSLFAWGDTPESLILGAKLASTLMPALASLAVWWLLRNQNVRWATLWTVGLWAISEAFLYRMSMPRAQSASLLVLALGLHWLLQRCYWALIPLGFAYVWFYNAFPLLLLVAAVSVGSTWLTERRLEWKALLYPALGLGLGLLVNPYFPQNLTFIAQHILPKIGPEATAISVGNEWYPYSTWTLVEKSGGALAIFVLSAIGLGWRGQRMDRATLTALLLSVAFGFMLFKSRRFIEYFPAFTLMFAALSFAPLLEHIQPKRRGLLLAGLVSLLVLPLSATLTQAREAMQASPPATRYAAAAQWLQAHSTPGSLVFQTDWDDFPRLFFYNQSNLYTLGLDPTYMQLYDSTLYDEWVAITRGEVRQPSTAIAERFGAEFVFSDLKHGAFEKRAAADAGLKEVYRDDEAVIYTVNR
jgi:hypothetical protein